VTSNRLLSAHRLDRLAAAALLAVVLALSALAPALAMSTERARPTAVVVATSTLDVLAGATLSQTDDGDITVCAICKSPVCTGHSVVLNAASPDSVVPVAWTLVPSLPFTSPKPLPAGPPPRATALPPAFNPRAPPLVG